MTATKILQSDESQLAAAIARWDDEGGLSRSAPGDAAARKSKEGSDARAEDSKQAGGLQCRSPG
jgi:hypothetical protein